MVLTDTALIFCPHLQFLEARVKGDKIEVIRNQHDPDLDYGGGEMTLTAEHAEVMDQRDKQYTIQELGQICEAYWKDWEEKQKN